MGNQQPKNELVVQNKQALMDLAAQLKHRSSIYINDEVASGLFRREGVESGYVYNIGYDQLTLILEENNDEGAVSQIQHLDDYDRSVYDAVCTLYNRLSVELKQVRVKKRKDLEKDGYTSEQIEDILNSLEYKSPMFTTKMVYQIITGVDDPTMHPSDDALDRIEESLDKLCSMRVNISLYKQSNHDTSKREKDSVHTNNVLFLGKHEKTISIPDNTNNKNKQKKVRVPYYVIYEVPVLYDYAFNNAMISMLPTEKVKTGSVRMTRMNIELVAKIRNIILNSGPSIVLNLEEIYENFNEEGISYATMRKRCQRIRETIPRILDDWQKSEFIDDWSFLDYNVKGTPTSILVHNTHNYKCDYVLEEFAQYQINKSSKE